MDPAFAMAEINLFGEVGVLKTINQLIDAAANRNDEVLRHVADYIRSDERTHVRKGGRIIGVMTDLEAKALGRQHALVADMDTKRIRGIFSASHVARRLGVDLQTSEVAHTFAEIEAALAH